MPRRFSGRAALRVLVLLAGWVVFVATSNVDRTFSELEVDGAIPVRDGHGEASVVFELDGFYVDPRAEVVLVVSSRVDLSAPPDAGGAAASFHFTGPDGAEQSLDGTLDGLPAFFDVLIVPAEHCGATPPCTLALSISVDAAQGIDADVPVELPVRLAGRADVFDLDLEHFEARLEVAP